MARWIRAAIWGTLGAVVLMGAVAHAQTSTSSPPAPRLRPPALMLAPTLAPTLAPAPNVAVAAPLLPEGLDRAGAERAVAPAPVPPSAAPLSALARFDLRASQIFENESGLHLDLAITQPVPWRVRFLSDPPRLILDMREVDWTGLSAEGQSTTSLQMLRAGVFRPGWSRLVATLAQPMKLARAGMTTEGPETRVALHLVPASEDEFLALATRPEPPEWVLPRTKTPSAPPRAKAGWPMRVVLDAGHGGLDPGAEHASQREADLVLTFALELKDRLMRDGRFEVVLTREEDVFVPLETRISLAREAGADAFLSLHADALAEGEAQGATLYTLSDAASDAATAALAERHARDDLLSGVDLSAQDDLVASVLMDMARVETKPRTERLSQALEQEIREAGLRMHRKPRQEGAFSVLKAADIPSVLLELGFMSSERDFKRLTDPAWRGKMAAAVAQALAVWGEEDMALRAARRP